MVTLGNDRMSLIVSTCHFVEMKRLRRSTGALGPGRDRQPLRGLASVRPDLLLLNSERPPSSPK
jgi:hypothetical protein